MHDPRIEHLLDSARAMYANGGVLFASFDVGVSETFDWFTSRNRLLDFGIIKQLLHRPEVASALPALSLRTETFDVGLETHFDCAGHAFDFDAHLAQRLYHGGAYSNPVGDGRAEKERSYEFCDALFGLRFAEITYCVSYSAWTRWLGNLAWDWTAVLFDRRARILSILTTTDTD